MSDGPKIIHRYEIIERLGHGGMGDLYLAKDPMLDRFVAIKLLRAGLDSGELRERFAREARSAARLAHVNIVTIYDVGEHDGQPYIAMEYVRGETLFQIIRRMTELPLGTKLQYIDELCAGLAHAHKSGIVHRDIKPANLMLAGDGTLKILDFGIARLTDSSMTQSGMVLGTLNYMSPEQLTGEEIDQRSDIFAVGAVAYELLSYQQAFPGGIDTGAMRIISGTPEPLDTLCPGIEPALVAIIDRALSKSPADRFEDLTAMRADLAKLRTKMDRKVLDAPSSTSIKIKKPVLPAETPAQMKTPRRGTSRDDIKRRREEELAAHLATAREAFKAGRMEEASAACERVLILEPEHDEAHDLSERARVAIERQQIRDWMAEARNHLDRGDLDAARRMLSSITSVDDSSPEAATLRAAIAQAESRRLADQTVAGGRSRLKDGDASAAADAARDALRAHPTHTGAAALLRDAGHLIEEHRRKAEHNRRAAEIVDTARRCFAGGELDEAMALLSEFSPQHPDIDQALSAMREEAREIRDRQRALEQQAAAEVVVARAWLIRDDLEEAASAVERARAIAPDFDEIESTANAIDERRAELAAQRRADEETRRTNAENDSRRRALEQERIRKADEKRRAEEEAARVAEQAKQAAEDVARRAQAEAATERARAEAERQAAEQAKRRAAQEAQQQAAAEAKQRADAEAKQKAEQRAAAEREREQQKKAEKAEKEARRQAAEDQRRRAADAAKRSAASGDATIVQSRQAPSVPTGDATIVQSRQAPSVPTGDATIVQSRQAPIVPTGDATVVQKKRPTGEETGVFHPAADKPIPLVSTPPAAAIAGAGAKQVVPIAAGAIVLVILIALGVWRFTRTSDEVAVVTPPVEATPPASPAPTPPATPSNVPTGTLVIDAAPWAEIVEIVGANGSVNSPVKHTPATLTLAEGEYRVTLRNPSDPNPRTVTARVTTAGARAFAEFKAVDVDDYFRRAGS